MPIDLLTAFNRTTSQIANKSAVGYIIGHPVWFAALIVGTLMLILWISNFEDWSFKFWFYTSISVLGLVVAHDIIIVDQTKECLENKTDRNLINGVHSMNGLQPPIQPRSDTDVRQGLVAGAGFGAVSTDILDTI